MGSTADLDYRDVSSSGSGSDESTDVPGGAKLDASGDDEVESDRCR